MTRFFAARFLRATILWAQIEQGSFVGVVTDPQKVAGRRSGRRRSSASTTNVKRSTVTNASGEYNSLPLPAGRYSVTVRQPGFRERTAEVDARRRPAPAARFRSRDRRGHRAGQRVGERRRDRDGVVRDRPGAAIGARSATCR